MEKEKKTCVVDDEKNSSTSKNSELQRGNQTAENKYADEIPPTDADQSSDDQSPSQSQVQNIDESTNNLPPEILLQILGNLDAASLFSCRLVSRQFNSSSTEILCCGREVGIKFELRFKVDEHGELMLVKRGEILKEKKSLTDFVDCMKQSEKCPFVRFSFDFISSSSLKLDHFLADFDFTGIKCLKLSVTREREEGNNCSSIFDTFELIQKLGDLLLNKIAHLEEFGLDLPGARGSRELNLFPSSSSIQLPQLKVVHLESSMVSNYPGIVGDLLTAAVNLEKIESFNSWVFFNFSVSDFLLLHSLGKLDLVQQLDIKPCPWFIREMKEKFPNLPDLLKLRELELDDPYNLLNAPEIWPDVAVFLSALFHSSKNTLETLILEQFECFENVEWPRFSKLESLWLDQHSFSDDDAFGMYQFFPPGVNSLDIFPMVRDLNLNIRDWLVAFPNEWSIPCLPNVERIQLRNQWDLDYRIEQLPLLCPNVKHLNILDVKHLDIFNADESREYSFLYLGQEIATHLPKLESLQLDVYLNSEENDSHAIDSFFTGFSEENCKHLFDLAFGLNEAVKKPVRDFESDSDSVDKIPKSESEFEAELDSELMLVPEREHPSIFHMKNLRKLTVKPFIGRKLVESKYFMDKLTWIGKKYGLELMPQLELTVTGKNND